MKDFLIYLLLLVFLLSITACSHIEDTNGDDTSLVTINDEKIASTSISASSSGISTNSIRDNITLIDADEEIDLDALEMDGGPLSVSLIFWLPAWKRVKVWLFMSNHK